MEALWVAGERSRVDEVGFVNGGGALMDGLSVTLDLSEILIQNPTFLSDAFDNIEDVVVVV